MPAIQRKSAHLISTTQPMTIDSLVIGYDLETSVGKVHPVYMGFSSDIGREYGDLH